MKTAKEFVKDSQRGVILENYSFSFKDMEWFMINFAKEKVENAKKEYKRIILQEGLVTEAGVAYLENAYPLENIK